MPSVAFVSADFSIIDEKGVPNGCTWYRCVLPSEELHRRGWETGVGWPALNDEVGLGIIHNDGILAGWDVTVLKLLMHRATIPAMQVAQRSSPVAVDVDDFHIGLHGENLAATATDPHINPEVNRAWYEQIIRQADFITVSTEFLQDWYIRRVRDVRLVRNGVDIERYEQTDLTEPVIGWVGATLWRSQDLELLAEWLPAFVKDHGTRVHHAGHIEHDPKDFKFRTGVEATTEPMALITEYPNLLKNITIGLVPLQMIPFNEAKSTIKGLEYAASGIPFIASPTHEYRLLAEAGVGRIATTPDEWRDHATELLDPDVRAAEGARIREIVRRDFSITARGAEWDTALRG